MNLPFTAEQFMDVFRSYNLAVWPMIRTAARVSDEYVRSDYLEYGVFGMKRDDCTAFICLLCITIAWTVMVLFYSQVIP